MLAVDSVLRGAAGQTGSGARCSRCPQRPAGRAQGEAAPRRGGGGASEADPARTEAGDHEAEEAGQSTTRREKVTQGQPLTHSCLHISGIPGDAAAAGYPAPAGAGEGAADASGAAEAHHPDESPDAGLLPPLRSGSHFTVLHLNLIKISFQTPLTSVCRCSLCLQTWQEGWCTSLVPRPATQAPSALLAL